jgi:hypothetical protein
MRMRAIHASAIHASAIHASAIHRPERSPHTGLSRERNGQSPTLVPRPRWSLLKVTPQRQSRDIDGYAWAVDTAEEISHVEKL